MECEQLYEMYYIVLVGGFYIWLIIAWGLGDVSIPNVVVGLC